MNDPTMANNSGPLSASELRHFVDRGYVYVPQLIPADKIELGLARLRDACGVVPDRPDTWSGLTKPNLGEAGVRCDLSPCLSDGMRAVAHQLAGPHIRCQGFTPILRRPDTSGEPPSFSPTGGHIDGVRQGLTLYPAQRYLVMLAYLTDVGPYDGALGVYPGSHRQVFEYGYRTGNDLSGDWRAHQRTTAPALGYEPVVGMPGQAGDVVFFHYLMVHCGSRNFGPRVRVGLNGIATSLETHPYRPRPGAPAPDWTPIDWTLRTDTLPAPA